MALHHAAPGEVVDLLPGDVTTHEEHSTAIVKADHFETIRLVIPSGTEMPQHQVPGSIMLHCLEGHVKIGLSETSIELRRNQWVYLEGGAPHSVKGAENSVLLLTILFPPEGSQAIAGAETVADGTYNDCDCVDRWEAEGGPVVQADQPPPGRTDRRGAAPWHPRAMR